MREGVSSFLLGMGLGVGIGMLFAPRSGDKTRDLLKDKADESKDYLKRRSCELRDSVTDIVERGKEAIDRHKEALEEALVAGKQAYKEVVGQPGPSKDPTMA